MNKTQLQFAFRKPSANRGSLGRRLSALVMSLLLVCSLPLAAFAEEYDLANGSITITANDSGQYVTQEANNIKDVKQTTETVIKQTGSETSSTTNTVTIKAEGNATANVTIQDVNIANSDPAGAPQDHSGQAAVTIDVAQNAKANVTLHDVNIDVSGTGGQTRDHHETGEAAVQIVGNGDVTLELDGENTVQGGCLRAGVEKNTIAAMGTDPGSGNGKLTITDETGTSGSLEATGGIYGSGIGGGNQGDGSNITITGSAEVTAQGGDNGSGIGGGSCGSGSNITISGSAQVGATGGRDGAGIGGGEEGSGSVITITGSAEVTAQGGVSGAGIGGGTQGDGSNITISGSAQVGATGGRNGAGIGGGSCGSGSVITITGSAEVSAKGGDSGSGIGAGNNGNGNGTGSDITVSGDAQVKAQGGNQYTVFGQNYCGAGAAIGNGGESSYGTAPNPGNDVTPNTVDLNEGWIATYAPGAKMDSTAPESVTYKGDNGVITSTSVTLIPEKTPTCTEGGYKAGFQVGNKVMGREPLNSLGHDLEHHGAKAPTCQEVGWDAYDTCKREGCTYSTYVEKGVVDHQFTNYVPNPDAKCGVDGTKTAKCDHDCGTEDTVTDVGSALTHSFTKYISDGKATCTQDGSKIAQCDHGCGATDTKPDVGSALGHSFTHYVSNNDATYLKDGTKTAKCDHPGCNETHTITDPGTRLPAPLYQVKGKDGMAVGGKTEQKDGVLTITVEADFATLTGYLGGLQGLRAQGVDTIVFVANGATSTFALADLLASMTAGDSYALTHDGETVTFTLATGTDISSILK